MTIETLAQRCEALEIHLAFQEKLVRDLDELVRTLGDRLTQAEQTIGSLKQTMKGELPIGPADEPPPHY